MVNQEISKPERYKNKGNHFLLTMLAVGLSFISTAQNSSLTGTIIDSISKQPLAFVSITIKETKKGTITDIDGHFNFKNIPDNSILLISCIGYNTMLVTYSKKNDMPLVISLIRKNNTLEDVVVKSDLNPAHRIILLMQLNKKANDPLYKASYRYNSYTIASIGAGQHLWTMGEQLKSRSKPPPLKQPKPKKPRNPEKYKKDSLEFAAIIFAANELKKNYFLVTESYSENIYKYFKQSKETVLATKVSGIKDPIFAVTNSSFQPFGFYLDFLPMMEKVFTSPVINGSIDMYKFNLREVLPHEKDTTYIISFEPSKGKNFEGLKGLLYINSDGYAIENVIASPANDKGLLQSFRLQQKYDRVDGHWFPSQLNTYIALKDGKNDSVLIYWDTRSYIKNVVINQTINRTEFSDIGLEFLQGAGKKTEAQWQLFRADSLKLKEKATYNAYDSLPKKMLNTLNGFNKIMEPIALEAIPWGKIDIPFKYLISNINRYEDVRLGLGFQTNRKFSNWFSLGGYAGYGFGDNAWKYGANTEFTFNNRTNAKFRISFAQDLEEPGNVAYFRENAPIFSSQTLRNFFTNRLDSVRKWKFLYSTKPRPFLQTDAWLLTEQRNPASYDYGFDLAGNNNFVNQYNNSEIGVGLRYTRGETYARVGRAKILNTPPLTQIMFQATRGLKDLFGGQLNYTKLAVEMNHSFNTKHFGRTSLHVDLGQVWGNVPYAYLFNARGSINNDNENRNAELYINNRFQTVGIYEFTSDRTANLFLKQNFGNLLFRSSNPLFRPELILVQNIGYGSINQVASHKGIVLQAPEKGLFETGLLVNNILRLNARFFYIGFSAGVFHRYGNYALPDPKNNTAFKWGFTISY